jgi:hypothetical protein
MRVELFFGREADEFKPPAIGDIKVDYWPIEFGPSITE